MPSPASSRGMALPIVMLVENTRPERRPEHALVGRDRVGARRPSSSNAPVASDSTTATTGMRICSAIRRRDRTLMPRRRRSSAGRAARRWRSAVETSPVIRPRCRTMMRSVELEQLVEVDRRVDDGRPVIPRGTRSRAARPPSRRSRAPARGSSRRSRRGGPRARGRGPSSAGCRRTARRPARRAGARGCRTARSAPCARLRIAPGRSRPNRLNGADRRRRAGRGSPRPTATRTRPERWRSAGTCATVDPFAETSWCRPSIVTRPRAAFRTPASASVSSTCPLPSIPAMPRISPARTSKVTPWTASHPRSLFTQRSSTQPNLGRLGRARERQASRARSSPIISSASRSLVALGARSVSTCRPRRRTVKRSETDSTSSSLWLMRKIATPSDASVRRSDGRARSTPAA